VISPETRMMGLPYGEEIIIVGQTMWTQSTSVTDRRTDRQTDSQLLSQRPCNTERRTVKTTRGRVRAEPRFYLGTIFSPPAATLFLRRAAYFDINGVPCIILALLALIYYGQTDTDGLTRLRQTRLANHAASHSPRTHAASHSPRTHAAKSWEQIFFIRKNRKCDNNN